MNFGLPSLFIAIGLLAVWFASVVCPEPWRLVVDSTLRVACLAVLITLIAYGRGSIQAFAIGSGVWLVCYSTARPLGLQFSISSGTDQVMNVVVFFLQRPMAGWLPLGVLIGFICVWTRAMVKESGGST